MIHKHRFADMDWFWLSRAYLNERVASIIFERQMRYAKRRKGALDAGLYRHGQTGGPIVYITAVSHRTEGLAELAPILLGEDVLQDRETVESLIRRRVRVLEDLYEKDAEGGSYRIHHGEPTRMNLLGETEDE